MIRHLMLRAPIALLLLGTVLIFSDYTPSATAQEGAPDAAPAAKVSAENPEEGARPTETSMLTWIVHVSGLIGLFIFALSFYFVAVVVQELLALRSSVAAPPEVVAECEKSLEERNVKRVVEIVQGDDSYFSRALIAGISELRFGLEEAREKLDRTADVLTADMERRVSFLAVLGTLGPMIGLLGTLKGMIASFSVIAISGVNLEASKVAEGISEALVLTFEGVLLSVPAIYFYAFFRNRISKISLETTMLADDFLRSCARIVKPASHS